jgi:hypothetical protein
VIARIVITAAEPAVVCCPVLTEILASRRGLTAKGNCASCVMTSN